MEPAFFVDTTDIWMAPKGARVATSSAGVAADLMAGGLLMAVITLFPGIPVAAVLFQIYLWQSQVRGLIETVLSGQDILSAVLVGGLALMAGVPLILGLLIKGALLAGVALSRLRERRSKISAR